MPHTSPDGARNRAIISWSLPMDLLNAHRQLLDGSPSVASCNVETPVFDRAMSAIWLTSSP